MQPVLILYATREGHTRRVAEHIAATLRARGLSVDVHDARRLPETFSLSLYQAAIVAASLHGGQHEPEMIAFVKDNRNALDHMSTAFLSVSLTEATVENPEKTPEERAEASAQVKAVVDRFIQQTGWHPTNIKAVAGALVYTQYGVIKRFVMRLISKKAGGPTDTTHDYVFTDWAALDRFVDELGLDRG